MDFLEVTDVGRVIRGENEWLEWRRRRRAVRMSRVLDWYWGFKGDEVVSFIIRG
jgi:hypothetical protein